MRSCLKMAFLLFFIFAITGCSDAPQSKSANTGNTGAGAVTGTGKLLAVYKYSGGVMVGVEGTNWNLSVSGGGVPTMLTITDPNSRAKRTYRYSEDDWRNDPEVQNGNLETLIDGIAKDSQNIKVQEEIRRTQERQINSAIPKSNPTVPQYTPPSNTQSYTPPRTPTVPTVPTIPGIPGR